MFPKDSYVLCETAYGGKEGKREVFTSFSPPNTPPGSADPQNPPPPHKKKIKTTTNQNPFKTTRKPPNPRLPKPPPLNPHKTCKTPQNPKKLNPFRFGLGQLGTSRPPPPRNEKRSSIIKKTNVSVKTFRSERCWDPNPMQNICKPYP